MLWFSNIEFNALNRLARIITFILIASCSFTVSVSAQNKVAITFDDLICLRCDEPQRAADITEKLLKTLQDYKVPAIGFVNESKLYSNGEPDPYRINLLEDWLRNGHTLGNHTFSHVWINNTRVEEYAEDIRKGEKTVKPLLQKYGQELTYFRHPQLRTGPTRQYRTSLDSVLSLLDYTTAPVTIDNDEYIHAHCYDAALNRGDSAAMRLIAYDYFAYMKSIIRHFKRVSERFLGYNLPHVLLLHANALNADYLAMLLAEFRSLEYSFIPLSEALQDSAYQLPEAVCTRGLSWLNRWQLAAGEDFRDPPAVSATIQSLYQQVRQGDYEAIYRPELMGPDDDIQQILQEIQHFSKAYMRGDYQAIANAYTEDGKIFPNNADIVSGKESIEQRWTMPQGVHTLHHSITPLEIEILGDTAYDHGYYEGSTRYRNGTVSKWAGKYVIFWKKIKGEWKIHLDIWNAL